jgi:uncharacterized protein YjbJ (UPF0337 family)
MILFQKFRRFFLVISLVLLLGTFTAFASENSLAQTQIASMNRVEATTKNIEGKVQETMGNVTGNKKDQFMGKAKQAESKVRNAIEDVKIKTEKAMDDSIVNPNYLPGRITNDIKTQSRNPADQMKDDIRNAFK